MDNWSINQIVDLALTPDKQSRAYATASVGDKDAHTWTITVRENGAAADIGGATVMGYFQRDDGATVAVEGSISGSVATITLPQECYAVPGTVRAVARLSMDIATTITVASATLAVGPNVTCEIIDPGQVIPNIEDLLVLGAVVLRSADDADAAAALATEATQNADAATAATQTATEATEAATAAAEQATVAADAATARALAAADNVELQAWQATLKATGWANLKQAVVVPSLLAGSTVWPSYDPTTPANREAYQTYGIYAVEQHNGQLIFACAAVPTVDITVNIAYGYRAPITATGAIATLQDVPEGAEVSVTARMVATQSGTGDLSPENVRPIVAAPNPLHVARHGKNMIPIMPAETRAGITATVTQVGEVTLNGTATANATFTVEAGVVIPVGTYTAQMNNPLAIGTSAANSVLLRFAYNGVYQSSFNLTAMSVGVKRTFTTTATMDKVQIYVAAGVTLTNFTLRPSLELGSTATAYEPYTGGTYTVALPQALYGLPTVPDLLQADTGAIVRHTGYLSFAGTEIWGLSSGQPTDTSLARFVLTETAVKLSGQGICSHLPWTVAPNNSTALETVGTNTTGHAFNLFIKKSRLAGWDDAWTTTQKTDAIKAWLASQAAAGKPVQVVYERDVPLTTITTPVTIPALPGLNNVYTDGGGDTTALA